MLRWLALRTEKVVAGHWRFVERVADTLVSERTIRRARFVELVRDYVDGR
jgi:hypothetical protein